MKEFIWAEITRKKPCFWLLPVMMLSGKSAQATVDAIAIERPSSVGWALLPVMLLHRRLGTLVSHKKTRPTDYMQSSRPRCSYLAVLGGSCFLCRVAAKNSIESNNRKTAETKVK